MLIKQRLIFGMKKIEKSIMIEPTLDRFLSNMDRNLSITVRNTGNWSAFKIALTA